MPPVPIVHTKADDALPQGPHTRPPLPLRPERDDHEPYGILRPPRDNFLLQHRGALTHSSPQALLRMRVELEPSKLLLAHPVPLPSSASFTLEGEEDALVPTLRNALLDARIIHVHGGPMLHRHRDTYPRLQWTTQTLLDVLPPLILLLLLRVVILVFSSISTATSSPSWPVSTALPLEVAAAARASGELAARAVAILVHANGRPSSCSSLPSSKKSTMRVRDGVTARLRLPGAGKLKGKALLL
ncbi:hypothetical protein C8R45DRAFT_1221150 [Mycena sanguinolenta]|nr:hypothetical protein C8R45DRAFT_1221150 [Mycena sanguinolenta]